MGRILELLRRFFADPGRRALAWSALGILGLALAAGGVVLMNRGGGRNPNLLAAAADLTPTTASATPSLVPSATPGATPSPAPSDTPTPIATATPTSSPRPAPQREQSSGGGDAATATPTPTQAPAAVTAAGPYCATISNTAPPNSVIGLISAPAGTSVALAFDGMAGPTVQTTTAGGYRVDYAAGDSSCANRVGAAISVVYAGHVYPTGHTVGDSPGAPVRFDIP